MLSSRYRVPRLQSGQHSHFQMSPLKAFHNLLFELGSKQSPCVTSCRYVPKSLLHFPSVCFLYEHADFPSVMKIKAET